MYLNLPSVTCVLWRANKLQVPPSSKSTCYLNSRSLQARQFRQICLLRHLKFSRAKRLRCLDLMEVHMYLLLRSPWLSSLSPSSGIQERNHCSGAVPAKKILEFAVNYCWTRRAVLQSWKSRSKAMQLLRYCSSVLPSAKAWAYSTKSKKAGLLLQSK